MTRFQIILTGVFVFFILAGVLSFSMFRGGSGQPAAELVFWGTLPEVSIRQWLADPAVQSDVFKITYIEKDENSLESDFVEALASGNSPDLVMLPDNLLIREYNKIVPIPYSSLPERDFKDTFIQNGEIFLSASGIAGLPLTVDPLVMYYNRDMLSSASIAKPPQYWDEFYTIAPTFNERNKAGGLTKTIVALGGFDNVKNAKAILSLLIMQSGNPIVSATSKGLASVLSNRFDSITAPTESALRFYTEFGNPVKPVYSWSRGLPNSQDAFAGETLATYFGFASELPEIRRKNPNLNFDVSVVPQIRDSKKKMTYGVTTALVVPKNAQNVQAAFAAESLLTSSAAISALSKITNLPPVRRDLLSKLPSQSFQSVFYSSALVSTGWLDPSYAETNNIFRDMVENVVSGRDQLNGAITRASAELNQLFEAR